MKGVYKIAIFVVLLNVVSSDRPPKKYSVNLDQPPKERWGDIFLKHKEYYRNNFNTAVGMIYSFLPMKKELEVLIRKVTTKIENELPMTMREEIKGIAESLDVNIGDVVLANILYDITAFSHSFIKGKHQRPGFCTSIVAEDINGTIWHARNLDYGLDKAFVEVLQNITMEVDFTRNGKIAYTATTYAGLTGFFTAQKHNVFTVSLDERNQGSILENLLVTLLEKNTALTSHLVRMAIDQASSFSDAVDIFSHTPTPAPVYVIIGGISPGQGVVITKDRLKAADVWYLEAKSGRWYVLETNYDHWKPAPKADDRRDVAIKAMNNVGQSHISKESLYKVLSVPPVLNKQTTYTTIMSAAKPEIYQTWLRNC